MHITTATILSNESHNDKNNTFVLSIGREGGNHSGVRKLLYEDQKNIALTQKYFDGTDWI